MIKIEIEKRSWLRIFHIKHKPEYIRCKNERVKGYRYILFVFGLFVVSLMSLTSVTPIWGEPVDISYDNVPRVKQDEYFQCWAAATASLYLWKNPGMSHMTTREIVALAGQEFAQIYDEGSSRAISGAEEDKFYSQMGLIIIKGQNPSIDGWAALLKDYGPLSITISFDPNNPQAYHGVVITGIKGDGTANQTKVSCNDPADGESHTYSFEKFLTTYEWAVKWPNQIIHWPKN